MKYKCRQILFFFSLIIFYHRATIYDYQSLYVNDYILGKSDQLVVNLVVFMKNLKVEQTFLYSIKFLLEKLAFNLFNLFLLQIFKKNLKHFLLQYNNEWLVQFNSNILYLPSSSEYFLKLNIEILKDPF